MHSLIPRWAVFVLCCGILSACGSNPPSSLHWTTNQVIDAFRKAGLSIEDVHAPDTGEGLPSTAGAEAITFHITNPMGQATGYIFSLPTTAAAEQLQQSAMNVPRATANGFASLTFTHDNIYVMLFGSVSETTLRQYEDAIKTLK